MADCIIREYLCTTSNTLLESHIEVATVRKAELPCIAIRIVLCISVKLYDCGLLIYI